MKTLICDGNFLLYRILFTPSTNQMSHDGQPTGGTYVFLKTLYKALNALYGAKRVVVVWDGARSQRRTALYPEYKAVRPSDGQVTPEFKENFWKQQLMLEHMFRVLNIRSVVIPDKEGDDVIWRITNQLQDNGPVVILSDDKDMLTMLNEKVDVYRIGRDEYYSAQTFLDEYHFRPEIFKYWKAIVGDPSDNIKGVVGAGEKTADKFCKLVDNADISFALDQAKEHKDKKLKAIHEQWEIVERNVSLTDCSQEVFTPAEDQFIMSRLTAPHSEIDEQKFMALCEQYGFTSIKSSNWLAPFRKLT